MKSIFSFSSRCPSGNGFATNTGSKIKVYGWQGEGGNTTEETLQADFSK